MTAGIESWSPRTAATEAAATVVRGGAGTEAATVATRGGAGSEAAAVAMGGGAVGLGDSGLLMMPLERSLAANHGPDQSEHRRTETGDSVQKRHSDPVQTR